MPDALLAVKGYDADATLADLAERNIEAVIPGRSNRRVKIQHVRALYKQRNRIERMFGHLRIIRAIATRYDQLANGFLGMVHIAAAIALAKRPPCFRAMLLLSGAPGFMPPCIRHRFRPFMAGIGTPFPNGSAPSSAGQMPAAPVTGLIINFSICLPKVWTFSAMTAWADRPSTIRMNTPIAPHCFQRLCNVLCGPYALGASRLRRLLRFTTMIPLSIRRSSTRGLPWLLDMRLERLSF